MPAGAEAFQYAVLRVVPSVARGEAMNVAVVLFCRRAGFLALRAALDLARLRALDPALDLDAVRAHLAGLERVARGEEGAGPVAALPQSERFHWLVAPSSTVVQASAVHTGLCDDPQAALDRLYDELVVVPRG